MADKRLVNYIQSSLDHGTSESDIRRTLLNQGWQPAQIEDAMKFATQSKGVSPSQNLQSGDKPIKKLADPNQKNNQPSSGRPTGILIIGIVGLILSVLLLLGGIAVVILGTALGLFAGGIGTEESGTMATMIMIMSYIPLIAGILGLMGSIMLILMKKTGLYLTVVFGILAIVGTIPGIIVFDIISIVFLVIYGAIVAYLITQRKLFH